MSRAYKPSGSNNWVEATPNQFRAVFNVSAPDAALVSLGLVEIAEPEQPAMTETQLVRPGALIDVDGVPTREWQVVDLTAAEVAMRLDLAKADAKAAMIDWIDAFLAPFISGLPEAEPLAWGSKALAASQYGTASIPPELTAMLDAEAEGATRPVAEVRGSIAVKSSLFTQIIGFTTGLRSRVETEIDAATSLGQLPGILEGAKLSAFAKAGQLGL